MEDVFLSGDISVALAVMRGWQNMVINIPIHIHPISPLALSIVESFQIPNDQMWKCYDCSAELFYDGLMEALD